MAQDIYGNDLPGYSGGYDDPYGGGQGPTSDGSGTTGVWAPTGTGAWIQDPTTGMWHPYVQGDQWDNGRGNISINGTTYSYDAGIDLWKQTQAPQAPPPTAPPDQPPPTGGGDGGGGNNPPPPTLTPPGPPTGPPAWMGDAPTFTPPPFTKPDAFHAPTAAEVEGDPGYQFSRQQGEQALAQSQAAQGLANTGGSLKDFIAYGQNLANTRYNDVTARNKSIYDTNYQTQYVDPYKLQYQGAMDAFVPKMQEWQTKVAATADQRNFDWKAYLDKWHQYFDTITAQ